MMKNEYKLAWRSELRWGCGPICKFPPRFIILIPSGIVVKQGLEIVKSNFSVKN